MGNVCGSGSDKMPALTCVPDTNKHGHKDPRMHRKPIAARNAELPSKVDLRREEDLDVFNQGHIGSCTANSTAAAFHFCQHKERTQEFTPSRLFIYYNGRAMEHRIGKGGEAITDAIRSVMKFGVCPENDWPYREDIVDTKPNDNCYSEAAHHKATSAHPVASRIDEMKQCLSQGLPFVFGFNVYESFRSIGPSGLMPMPASNEAILGGHAVCVVGYDDSRQVLIIRNSWGSGWGDNGFFYMPYKFVTAGNDIFDGWCIQWVKDGKPHRHRHHHK